MSLWTRIREALEALVAGEGLSAVLEKFSTPPERTVAFAISVIALGAKMAKADGMVTRNEVAAFREVFYIAPNEEENAARIFNLARQDVSGFEAYARQIARMFERDTPVLTDLLEGLFHIATADGQYHPQEDDFLEQVAEIFGVNQRAFRAIRCRFVEDATPDPYDVLGVDPSDNLDTIRAAWRQIVRDSHPDRMIARGVPEEAVKLATNRLAAVNTAWETILSEKSAA